MFKESSISEKILNFFRKLIPHRLFSFFQPIYHRALSALGVAIYRFPAWGMQIIGVTGTKGKSTTVYMIARALEDQGIAVAAIGSLGFKIKDKEWPNNLHMTMPGRMKLQKFMRRAKNAGVTHVVLEATSEGIAQGRLFGIPITCAVLTNIHPEHIERHGSFEDYIAAKNILFQKAKDMHVLNIDDKHHKTFEASHIRKVITYGMKSGDINNNNLNLNLKIKGDFNIYNALCALAVVKAYGLDIDGAKETIENIDRVAGRMEYIDEGQDYTFVVDYAHTPESLEVVYRFLKKDGHKLIGIFGSDGGGRDVWKRPVFGRIASKYCDEIILTSENPYDSDPDEIADEIEKGIVARSDLVVKRIIDRLDAIEEAIHDAKAGDTIVMTGKGTEDSIVMANGRKIPWLDSAEVRKAILSEK